MKKQCESLNEILPWTSFSDLENQGCFVKNAVITKAEVEVSCHYGNFVSLSVEAKLVNKGITMTCDFLSKYGMTGCLGLVIKTLFDVLCEDSDDNSPLSFLKGKPLRLAFSKNEEAVAFGSYCDDNKFLKLDSLIDSALKFLKQPEV